MSGQPEQGAHAQPPEVGGDAPASHGPEGSSEARGDAPASHRSEDGGAPRRHPPEGSPLEAAAPGSAPAGTTELGIDIVRVGRIGAALERFGERFSARVLTGAERRYVGGRAETFAGRWAAKEAVSKVLGLGVRGIGWRDIEIERMPTGQPAVLLHGRAAARAEQLGMERIAISITHESDYAVAIAFGIRTAGGRYVLPADIETRLDERERRILARMDRLHRLAAEADRG
jgi:holo-[acyl-carrier protein] synthase